MLLGTNRKNFVSKDQVTPWFNMKQKPVWEGQYQGREARSRAVVDIFWRTLQDTTKPGWYFRKGVLGPFLCWENAEGKVTSWRGLANKPN